MNKEVKSPPVPLNNQIEVQREIKAVSKVTTQKKEPINDNNKTTYVEISPTNKIPEKEEKTNINTKDVDDEKPQYNYNELNKTFNLLKITLIIGVILILILLFGTTFEYLCELSEKDLIIPKIILENTTTEEKGFFEILISQIKMFNYQKENEFFKLIKKTLPNWFILWILPIFSPMMLSLAMVINWLGIFYYWVINCVKLLFEGQFIYSMLYGIMYLFLFFFPFPFLTIAGLLIPFIIYCLTLNTDNQLSNEIPFSTRFSNVLSNQSVPFSIIMMCVVSILSFIQYGNGVGVLALIISIIASILLIRNSTVLK